MARAGRESFALIPHNLVVAGVATVNPGAVVTVSASLHHFLFMRQSSWILACPTRGRGLRTERWPGCKMPEQQVSFLPEDRSCTPKTYSDTSDCYSPSWMSCRPQEAALGLLYRERAAGMAISLPKPTLTLKQSFRFTCISPMLVSYKPSKTPWLGSGEAHSVCVRRASNPSRKPDWKRCPGRATAATARSNSVPKSNTERKR